jgi:hypothetical protein
MLGFGSFLLVGYLERQLSNVRPETSLSLPPGQLSSHDYPSFAILKIQVTPLESLLSVVRQCLCPCRLLFLKIIYLNIYIYI